MHNKRPLPVTDALHLFTFKIAGKYRASMNGRTDRRMDERTNERTNERMNEYLTEDFEELHDIDDPGTESGRRLRLGPNEVRVEIFVFQVWLDGSLAYLGNVLLVVVDQRRQKIIDLQK